jgi:hypothetical protein
MGYDELSFQPPQLVATADLSIPEATFHLRLSQDAWAACSVLTPRTVISDTSTVRLLREISPPHDFAVAVDDLHSVPLGYAAASRVVESFSEFLSHTQPDERWSCLIVFEPLGFLIYGRWTTDDGELLVQDARGPLVSTVVSIPRSRVMDWAGALDRLASTRSSSGGEERR